MLKQDFYNTQQIASHFVPRGRNDDGILGVFDEARGWAKK